MANKIKGLRDRLPKKTKLIIYISTAAFVFVLCALLPLAFRGEVIVDGVFDTSSRAALFAKYIEKDSAVKTKIDTKPDKAEIKYCENIFDELYSMCVVDEKKSKPITQGQEFMILSDGDNSMRLCRMWIQDQGDWTNWLDAYIDADTGFVYYLYISSICLDNSEKYFDVLPAELNAKIVADRISAETDFTLEILNWTGKAEDTANAFTYSGGEALIWNINCSYYPASMIDIKICVA